MSTRIKLAFRHTIDERLIDKLPEFATVIRLICKAKFKTPTDWTKTHNAIVDTGGSMTLIPLSIWQDMDTDIIADHEIKGVNPRDECKVPVKIAKVKAVLFDLNGNNTGELEIPAYLSMLEDVPLLLGFKDLLSRFKVCFDYQKKEAYIELNG